MTAVVTIRHASSGLFLPIASERARSGRSKCPKKWMESFGLFKIIWHEKSLVCPNTARVWRRRLRLIYSSGLRQSKRARWRQTSFKIESCQFFDVSVVQIVWATLPSSCMHVACLHDNVVVLRCSTTTTTEVQVYKIYQKVRFLNLMPLFVNAPSTKDYYKYKKIIVYNFKFRNYVSSDLRLKHKFNLT